MIHCLNPRTVENEQLIRSTVAGITSCYAPLFKPIIKQLGSCTDAYLFAKHIKEILEKLPNIIDKYANREEYKVYPLGCVAQTNYDGLVEILRLPFTQLLGEL